MRVTDMLWSFPERFLRVSHQFGRAVRRDVVGMTPEQIRASLDGLARLYPGHFNVAFERTTLFTCQMVASSTTRCLLATWLYLRRLQCDYGRDISGWRLGRFL